MIMMGFEDTVLCTGVPSFVVAILIIIMNYYVTG